MNRTRQQILKSEQSSILYLYLCIALTCIAPSSQLLAKSEIQIRADRIQKFSKFYGLKKTGGSEHRNARNGSQFKSNNTNATQSYSTNVSDTHNATQAMLVSIENQLTENDTNEKDELFEKYLTNTIKRIEDPNNDIAMHLFSQSVRTIKAVFRGTEITENKENLVQAIKQVACIFVAETRYGNLSKNYDLCDQTNIGQIRPPAYKAIFDRCEKDFTSEKLAFLGEGTNCKTLHPYEMPYCCEALKTGENKASCDRYHNQPKSCISKEKRAFLEETNQDNELEQISCINTYGERYWRVPAVPSHSVFAAIYYLRIMNYKKMTDKEFSGFGAAHYNAAGGREEAGYQKKLETCLGVLNKNTALIKNALSKVEANNN
jgi:hypothetical protein